MCIIVFQMQITLGYYTCISICAWELEVSLAQTVTGATQSEWLQVNESKHSKAYFNIFLIVKVVKQM